MASTTPVPTVYATSLSPNHDFTKPLAPKQSLKLIAGYGIEGDCHAGPTVQHRSRLHIRPPPPNLRQVHLIDYETLSQHNLKPGEIGENITTTGIDLLGLGEGMRLHFLAPRTDQNGNEMKEDKEEEEATEQIDGFQDHAIVRIAGLRNPCPQIEKHRKGLQEKFIERNEERKIVKRKAGVMGVVETGGIVTTGMRIVVEKAERGYVELGCV